VEGGVKGYNKRKSKGIEGGKKNIEEGNQEIEG